jgi:hypothetical protein
LIGKCFTQCRVIAICLAAFFAWAPTVSAKTLGESAASTDIFGASWSRPEPIAVGLANISQAIAVTHQESLRFPPLLPGARQLRLRISTLLGADVAYAIGGQTLCSTSPMVWQWDKVLHGPVFQGFWRPSSSVAFSLSFDGDGTISLTVDFVARPRNNLVAYAAPKLFPIVVTATSPAVVPLPLPGAALASALGALLLVKRRRARLNCRA